MPARCPALLVLSALLATPAAAQSPPATELDTVQVQVERYDARRDDTATRIVVDAQTLQQYGDTALLDALKRLPGVSVVPGSAAARRRSPGSTAAAATVAATRSPERPAAATFWSRNLQPKRVLAHSGNRENSAEAA